jgi:hypothetical protein
MIINYVPYLIYHHTTSSRVALFVYSVRRFVVRFHGGKIKISACLREHHHTAARTGNGMLWYLCACNERKKSNSDHTVINRKAAFQCPPTHTHTHTHTNAVTMLNLSSCRYRIFQIHSVRVQSYDTQASLMDRVSEWIILKPDVNK